MVFWHLKEQMLKKMSTEADIVTIELISTDVKMRHQVTYHKSDPWQK